MNYRPDFKISPRSHSDETRRKIQESVKAAIAKKKEAQRDARKDS